MQSRYIRKSSCRVYKRQSAGVHANVTREQARQCIIHTYIALGDILSLKEDVLKQSRYKKAL